MPSTEETARFRPESTRTHSAMSFSNREAMMRTVRLANILALGSALVLMSCVSGPAAPEAALHPTDRFPIAVEPQMRTYRLPLQGASFDPFAERELETLATDYVANGSG